MQGRFAAAAGPADSNDLDSTRTQPTTFARSIVRLLAAFGRVRARTPDFGGEGVA